MIGMRMREHDRIGMEPLKFSQPIKAAVDYHICAAVRNHQGRVHAMPSRPLLYLTARAEEGQFHREKLAFLRVRRRATAFYPRSAMITL
jgi:hypothetical protein